MLSSELVWVSHLPSFYQLILLGFHKLIGLPIDQINLLFMLLFQSVCGLIYSYIKNENIRKLFGTIIGLLLMYSLYGIYNSLLLIIYIIIMYPLIIYIFRYKSPWIIFIITMSNLLICFFYMFKYHYLSWRLDYTTSLMGITVRLNTLMWDLSDGDLINKNKLNIPDRPRIEQYRKQHGITYNPSFIQYMCYMLFFIHILCGSNLTFIEYIQINNCTLFKIYGWKNDHYYPKPDFQQILFAFFEVIITALVFLIGKIFIPVDFLFSKQFHEFNLFTKALIIFLCAWFTKWKYHFGWKALDLSSLTSCCAFSGVKYDNNGKVLKIEWNRAKNINSLPTAFPQHTAEIVRNWNMTINDWLTQYVFFRVNSPKWFNKITGSEYQSKVLITRLTSAVFHGVYPGYYIFFFFSAIATTMIDTWRLILPTYDDYVALNKENTIQASLLHIFWSLFVNFPIDSLGLFFMILDIKQTIRLFNDVYWYPIVIIVGGTFLGQIALSIFGKKKSQSKKTDSNDNSKKTK